jgi:hypothetical protein
MYTEILRKILLKTCELSELTEEQVKASREESARVARKILIEVLTIYFSDTEIAKFLCVKRQRVNAIRNSKKQEKRPFMERIMLRDLSMYTQLLLNEVETTQKQNKEP